MPANLVLPILAVFVALGITAVFVFTSGRKSVGLPAFLGVMLMESFVGLLDWVIFALVLVLIGGIIFKVGDKLGSEKDG